MLQLDATAVLRLISNSSRTYASTTHPQEPRRVTTEIVPATSGAKTAHESGIRFRAKVGVFRTSPGGPRGIARPAQWLTILEGPPRASISEALNSLLDYTHQKIHEQRRYIRADNALTKDPAVQPDPDCGSLEQQSSHRDGDTNRNAIKGDSKGYPPANTTIDSLAVNAEASASGGAAQQQQVDRSALSRLETDVPPAFRAGPGSTLQDAPPAPTTPSAPPQALNATGGPGIEHPHNAQDISASLNRKDEQVDGALTRIISSDSSLLSPVPSDLSERGDNDSGAKLVARGADVIAHAGEADAVDRTMTKERMDDQADTGSLGDKGDAETAKKEEKEDLGRGRRKKSKAKRPHDDHPHTTHKRKKDDDDDGDDDAGPAAKKPRACAPTVTGTKEKADSKAQTTAPSKKAPATKTTGGRRRTIFEMHDEGYYLTDHGDLHDTYVSMVKGATKRQTSRDWQNMRMQQVAY